MRSSTTEMRTKSGELIIGTTSGVIKAKTVRRLPEEQRWCAEDVFEHTRNTVKPCALCKEDITYLLKSTGQGMPNIEKMSTHQHKSARSVTPKADDHDRNDALSADWLPQGQTSWHGTE